MACEDYVSCLTFLGKAVVVHPPVPPLAPYGIGPALLARRAIGLRVQSAGNALHAALRWRLVHALNHEP
eukprot:4787739-Prorocentrum_lima.AAC.1